jgi:predicted  nucleic acid-binding Zn-ribbon protein
MNSDSDIDGASGFDRIDAHCSTPVTSMLSTNTQDIGNVFDLDDRISPSLDSHLETLTDPVAADRADRVWENIATDPDTLLLSDSSFEEIPNSALSLSQERPDPDRSPIEQSAPTTGEMDLETELDALLIALQLATPHPPNIDLVAKANSIDGILTSISTTAPVTHTQQLLQELNTTRSQLNAACTQLEILHQRNQVQVDRVDAHVRQAQQIKFSTQQLAQHSYERVEKVQQMLGSLEQIRTEIVTNLDKFGSYEEIRSMLAQLETTRYALVVAHERVTIGQQAFYDSLHAIQQQVATTSSDSENKFRQYHQSIENLSQTIATDRLKIAGMSVELSTKLHNLHALDAQITNIHSRVVETSQALELRLTEVERRFSRLSQSVSQEQQQFYELTVQTIEKAESVRSQFADISKQIEDDRYSISALQSEIESVKHDTQQQIALQLDNFNLRQDELILLCNNLQSLHKDRLAIATKFSRWLWILSFAVGIIFILLVRIMSSLN